MARSSAVRSHRSTPARGRVVAAMNPNRPRRELARKTTECRCRQLGGVRAVIAENLVLKHQLIVLRRPRQRAPNLTVSERLVCESGRSFSGRVGSGRSRSGVRPATLPTFHRALVRGKYRRLFSSSHRPRKPGPKGPSEALIRALVELKSRNPRFGCPRIARIISQTFGVDIDKNLVHRVLAKHYRPAPTTRPRGAMRRWRATRR